MQKIDLIKIYQRKTALVIDDFPDMRGSIKRMLVNAGIAEVAIAANGNDAIAQCESRAFDIILCDYNLGDAKNGQQVLEELRYRGLLKHTSIYMMVTAETTKSMVFGAIEYQPDDYLTKPFTQTVLQKRLDRLVLEKVALDDINQAMDERDFGRAIALCDRLIADKDRYEQKCQRIKAHCFVQQQHFAEARTIYEGVLHERPLEWAQIGLGQCMLESGDLDGAEQLFQGLIDHNCLCLEVYDYLAQIKSRRGDIAAAQQLLEHASDISPNAILRQQLLAEISENNGDWERAEKAHRKIVRLGANSCYESPENYFKLARCISTQIRNSSGKERKRVKDIEDVLDRARRRYRDDDQIKLQAEVIQAAACADAGLGDEARQRMDTIAERVNIAATADSPQSVQVTLDLARTYQAMGDSDTAQRLLRELAEKYPEDEAIGEAIDRLSDEPLSRKGKEQAVELNSRGKELFAAQEYPQAMALFGEALRHYPNNIALKLNLLLALVREMNANGPSEPLVVRAEQIVNSINTLADDHPLYDRFHVLWDHVDNLREDLDADD